MSKIANSIIDVPVNDTDYDYEKFKKEQQVSDAKQMEEEVIVIDLRDKVEDKDWGVLYDEDDMMVGQEEEEKVCEFCGGTGEVTTMEQVYPNEPHYAPIGTAKCICQLDDCDMSGSTNDDR